MLEDFSAWLPQSGWVFYFLAIALLLLAVYRLRLRRLENEELQEKILGNMSQRAADMLREEMEYLGPVRLSEVEGVQQQIVNVIEKCITTKSMTSFNTSLQNAIVSGRTFPNVVSENRTPRIE